MNVIRIDRRRLIRRLFGILWLLCLLHLIVFPLRRYTGLALNAVDLDQEYNIPTYFQMLLFLFNAGALLAIGRIGRDTGDSFAGRWRFLGWLFFMMGADEILIFHERYQAEIRELLDVGGALHFAWLVPGLIFLALLALLYLRWLLALPPRIRSGMIAAAALFLAGAVGMEMAGGLYFEPRAALLESGGPDLIYHLIVLVEEGLEMAGLTLSLRALLEHLAGMEGGARLLLDEAGEPS